MAGTGKSTIARTAAYRFSASGILTCSFFFRRGGGDRSTGRWLFTTIASQLASGLPAVASAIRDAIGSEGNISNWGLDVQFKKLILRPLQRAEEDAACSATLPKVITVVVDALDECESEGEIKTIIMCMAEAAAARTRLLFFVASRPDGRPEGPLQSGFRPDAALCNVTCFEL